MFTAVRCVCGGPSAEGVPVAREAAHPDALRALRPLLGLPAAAAPHLHRRLRLHAEGARGEQRGDVTGTEQRFVFHYNSQGSQVLLHLGFVVLRSQCKQVKV